MSHDPIDKLVKMANHIGTFFAAQNAAHSANSMCEHLQKFWNPRMRTAIIDHVKAGGAGLDPIAIEAINRLSTPGGSSGHDLEPGDG